MIDEILQRAGFELNSTYKESHFTIPPKSTYCVYLDECTFSGSDFTNHIAHHSYIIEMYSNKKDKIKEKAIEDTLNYYGIEFVKDSLLWLEDEGIYQRLYTFDYIEKLKED